MAAAWLVHLYTASGALLAFLATRAVVENRFRDGFFWLAVTVLIDATDGLLARRANVSARLPWFNGSKLDDIVDYLTYVFVPALIVWRAILVPDSWSTAVIAAMLLSSLYGFNRDDAKTSDHFFIGFPSYWNIVVFYLYLAGWSPVVNGVILLVCAALVFVPIRYVYPSRTREWQVATLLMGSIWGVLMCVMLWRMPAVPRAVFLASFAFPVYYLLLSLVLQFGKNLLVALVLLVQALTPDTVARRVQDRDLGRDSRAELRMRIYDRQGRVRERTLNILRLRGTGGQGDKILIRFLSPNDIKGTALLVWEHPNADDERFLYLPALGRVRRIAGEEKQQSFVGSDLTYEDIGGRDIADYTYAFGEENATWTAPDGPKVPAWALESRARDRNADFPRSSSLILKDRLVVAHADIYNQRNERAKIFDVRRLERVDAIWTVMDLAVSNEIQKTRTELVTTSIRYNVGLTENDFTRRELEQGVR